MHLLLIFPNILAALDNLVHSFSLRLPHSIALALILPILANILFKICSLPISKLNNKTLLSFEAIFQNILLANVVFPDPGLPAIIVNSLFFNPFIFLSRSINPVLIPGIFPPLLYLSSILDKVISIASEIFPVSPSTLTTLSNVFCIMLTNSSLLFDNFCASIIVSEIFNNSLLCLKVLNSFMRPFIPCAVVKLPNISVIPLNPPTELISSFNTEYKVAGVTSKSCCHNILIASNNFKFLLE